MTKNVVVRINPDFFERLKTLGANMRPPVSASAIANEMVKERLAVWERGYAVCKSGCKCKR